MAVIGSEHKFPVGDFETKNIKVSAGPGAGKTYFLVNNIKEVIAESKLITKSKERKVLCITYTNAAADEIKRRLSLYMDRCEISTIHSFIISNIISLFQNSLKEIMRTDFGIEVKTDVEIVSEVEGQGILHNVDKPLIWDFIAKETGMPKKEFKYSKKTMGELEVDCKKYIESVENSKEPVHEFTEPRGIEDAHRAPIKKFIWQEARKLTHDEILYFGYRILQENPLATYYLRVKFPFIFVDEFQDTSPLQTLLLKLVCEKSTHVCVVGDVAQSIYSFQGAAPSYFQNFEINGKIEKYSIDGNRRSSLNIVNFCNYIRRTDTDVAQYPIKKDSSNPKIHFLLMGNEKLKERINEIADRDNGVALTRRWADAFSFVRGISSDQATLLNKINNDYYYAPFELRNEIIEFNHVAWVKAFRFMVSLYEARQTGSLTKVISAIELYWEIQKKPLAGKVLLSLRDFLDEVFEGCEDKTMCELIELYNKTVKQDKYAPFKSFIDKDSLEIVYSTDDDRKDIIDRVKQLEWNTAYKLFTEILSEGSHYMTVHQAKGREWDDVVVSLKLAKPDRDAGVSLKDTYANPDIIGDDPKKEFVRLFYVACSRAKKNLYVQIDRSVWHGIKASLDKYNCETKSPFEYETEGEFDFRDVIFI